MSARARLAVHTRPSPRDDEFVSAHSFISIGERLILASREGYAPSLAALFVEPELRHTGDTYGYVTTAAQMRQRLHLTGITRAKACQRLDIAVQHWHTNTPDPSNRVCPRFG